MNLYVLRHGLATQSESASAAADRRRPLTAKGRKKMRRSVAAMKRMGVEFDLILSSPCRRAKETAELVAEAFGGRESLQILKELAPGEPAAAALAALRRQHLLPDNLLLVGHEPQLSGLVSLLLSGSPRLRIAFKKGGLCKLALPSWKPAARAALEWLLTPKQLR
jgi:phosphohistidine phosphatase